MYLDASALVKLVAREAESDALAEWLRGHPIRITSLLSKMEVSRAARRAAASGEDPDLVRRAADVLATVALISLTDGIADRASATQPTTLRSLDAVHLATAVLAAPIEAFVVYDDRLAAAADAEGLVVAQPGRR